MTSVNYFFEKTPAFKRNLPAKSWIKKCLLKENRTIGVLNFIFCSDPYLREINKKYLHKTYFTDVIAFQNNPPDFIKKRTNLVYGDIFISVDRVKENTKTYKTIFAEELKRVMIHGTLHLIGFKDKSKKDKDIMREKENNYIKLS